MEWIHVVQDVGRQHGDERSGFIKGKEYLG
jgi:hypothetical protein